ncbi:hypothetical protein DAMA08_025630 [Martiniozyma asiatica (nom. inval.)]|nr:hypothetical protein DAMA08_025630 [Martiniozyma asiatica]
MEKGPPCKNFIETENIPKFSRKEAGSASIFKKLSSSSFKQIYLTIRNKKIKSTKKKRGSLQLEENFFYKDSKCFKHKDPNIISAHEKRQREIPEFVLPRETYNSWISAAESFISLSPTVKCAMSSDDTVFSNWCEIEQVNSSSPGLQDPFDNGIYDEESLSLAEKRAPKNPFEARKRLPIRRPYQQRELKAQFDSQCHLELALENLFNDGDTFNINDIDEGSLLEGMSAAELFDCQRITLWANC